MSRVDRLSSFLVFRLPIDANVELIRSIICLRVIPPCDTHPIGGDGMQKLCLFMWSLLNSGFTEWIKRFLKDLFVCLFV